MHTAPELQELARDRVVVEDLSCCDLEHPAAHFEHSGLKLAGHELERTQVLELDQHVLLNRGGYPPFDVKVTIALVDELGDSRRFGEPAGDERQPRHPLRVENRLDRPAVRVAADDDVAHVQHLDGVFDRRRYTAQHASVERRDDVAHVSHDEELTGRGRRDEIGNDARVTARDEERLRALSRLGQLLEKTAIRGEIVRPEVVNPCRELLHTWTLARIVVRRNAAGVLSDRSMKAARLDERFGVVRAHATVLVASVLAAHGASGTEGFRLSDVRFFCYLFANWLERDVLYPGEAIDLTQVRRLMQRLTALGFATSAPRRGPRTRAGVRYALTRAGSAALIGVLSEAVDTRSFEEAVFVVALMSGYRARLLEQVAPEEAKRLRGQLDPGKLVVRVRRRIERVLGDLEARIASSVEMVREAAELRGRGAKEEVIASRLERLGVYQLQHVRSFADFVLSLPPDLRAFELGPGFMHRSRIIFETLAESARAQLRALAGLEARLAVGQAG